MIQYTISKVTELLAHDLKSTSEAGVFKYRERAASVSSSSPLFVVDFDDVQGKNPTLAATIIDDIEYYEEAFLKAALEIIGIHQPFVVDSLRSRLEVRVENLPDNAKPVEILAPARRSGGRRIRENGDWS